MKKKLLIVDDECNFRNMIAHILKGEGYKVSLAEDGIAALRDLATEICDVLITDIRMPNMDGIELFNNVKTLYPQMPVIFLSGSAYPKAIENNLKEGSLYYFEKPVDHALLKCSIKHILKMKDLETEYKDLLKVRNNNN